MDYDFIMDNYIPNKAEFFERFSDLKTETAEALWRIMQKGIVEFSQIGETYEFLIEETPAYRLSLAADDWQFSKKLNANEIYLYTEIITVNNDRYHVRFKWIDVENIEDEEPKNIDFYFSNPVARCEVFNCCEIVGQPWDCLALMADAIVEKAELSLSLCNQQEIELLPVLKDLKDLNFENIDSVKEVFAVQKQVELMNDAKSEDVWRGIYSQIAQSQKEYPTKVQAFADEKRLNQLRKEIETRLLLEGYSGKYPTFYKQGDMKGMHLANSYGMSYFVGMKKQVGYFIHCVEDLVFDELVISFVSAADLTKGNKCKDIYSCMFNDNGKRLFQITVFSDGKDDLALSLNTAMKRAQCKPLDKNEKKQEGMESKASLKKFLFWLVFAGGFFAILLWLLFIPCIYVFLMILGERMSFLSFCQLFSGMPFVALFALTWIGFGGAMGLIQILSERK